MVAEARGKNYTSTLHQTYILKVEDVFFSTVCSSFALIFIYCRYKPVVFSLRAAGLATFGYTLLLIC